MRNEVKLLMTIKRTSEHTTNWKPGVETPSGAMHCVVCALEPSNSFNERLGQQASIDRLYSRQ